MLKKRTQVRIRVLTRTQVRIRVLKRIQVRIRVLTRTQVRTRDVEETDRMIQKLESVQCGLQRTRLEARETNVRAVEHATLPVAPFPHEENGQVAVLTLLVARIR